MMVRWSGEVQVNVSGMSGERQISELDIGGRETCSYYVLSSRTSLTLQPLLE